jgi:hypothetical protein
MLAFNRHNRLYCDADFGVYRHERFLQVAIATLDSQNALAQISIGKCSNQKLGYEYVANHNSFIIIIAKTGDIQNMVLTGIPVVQSSYRHHIKFPWPLLHRPVT